MIMRSTRYVPHPREYDELMDVLTTDYEFVASEYPTAWRFRQFLKNLPLCDYSEIYDDVWFKADSQYNPIIMSRRVIFFSCRERDMERLSHILERLGGEATILSSEGDVLYGGYAYI